jgi:transposase
MRREASCGAYWLGMDLGKKKSQIAIITEAGELVEKRMRTERGRLMQYFKGRAPSRILMEASTISEWVPRLLEELSHEVVIADPNYAPMYAQRCRRVKTDKRDTLAPCRSVSAGGVSAGASDLGGARHVRALLTVRDSLVRSRARLVTLTQAVLSRDGFRVPTGSSGCFGDRSRRWSCPSRCRSRSRRCSRRCRHVHTAPASQARHDEREEKGEGPRESSRPANDALTVTSVDASIPY